MPKSNTLVDDIDSIVSLAYPIESILAGVCALLDRELEKSADGDGVIWHARQMLMVAKEKASDIYCGYAELDISSRAGEIDSKSS